MAVIDENPHELFGYVSSYPGSLIGMAVKVEQELVINENESDTSPLFNWFVLQETNALLHDVLDFLQDKDSKNWRELRKVLAQRIIQVPPVSGDEKVKKYLEYIMGECGFLSEKKLHKKIRRLFHEN